MKNTKSNARYVFKLYSFNSYFNFLILIRFIKKFYFEIENTYLINLYLFLVIIIFRILFLFYLIFQI